jgi:K+/H+ antiporter YhaU regulatory subunit KhtT
MGQQVPAAADGESTNRPLGQLRELRNAGVIVLAIRKQAGDTIFNPSDESDNRCRRCLDRMGERPNLHRAEKMLIS